MRPDGIASRTSASRVDVLLVTALKSEHDAALQMGQVDCAGNPGVTLWQHIAPTDRTSAYHLGHYRTTVGSGFTGALARATRTGSDPVHDVALSLVRELRPTCLAMCGVCAGHPGRTALGDVVFAQTAFLYDEGRTTPSGMEADLVMYQLDETWQANAQNFTTRNLPGFGPAGPDEARSWLLEQLYFGADPRKSPALTRYFQGHSWREPLAEFEAQGLLIRNVDNLELTEKGRNLVRERLYDTLRGPDVLPFEAVTGPMGSGRTVVKDSPHWERLAARGVRSIIALEMEAATIAGIAHRQNVPRWIVVKGVMDHANEHKDDRYKAFGERASAAALFAFLAGNIPPLIHSSAAETPPVPPSRRRIAIAVAALVAGLAAAIAIALPTRDTPKSGTPVQHNGGPHSLAVGQVADLDLGSGNADTQDLQLSADGMYLIAVHGKLALLKDPRPEDPATCSQVEWHRSVQTQFLGNGTQLCITTSAGRLGMLTMTSSRTSRNQNLEFAFTVWAR